MDRSGQSDTIAALRQERDQLIQAADEAAELLDSLAAENAKMRERIAELEEYASLSGEIESAMRLSAAEMTKQLASACCTSLGPDPRQVLCTLASQLPKPAGHDVQLLGTACACASASAQASSVLDVLSDALSDGPNGLGLATNNEPAGNPTTSFEPLQNALEHTRAAANQTAVALLAAQSPAPEHDVIGRRTEQLVDRLSNIANSFDFSWTESVVELKSATLRQAATSLLEEVEGMGPAGIGNDVEQSGVEDASVLELAKQVGLRVRALIETGPQAEGPTAGQLAYAEARVLSAESARRAAEQELDDISTRCKVFEQKLFELTQERDLEIERLRAEIQEASLISSAPPAEGVSPSAGSSASSQAPDAYASQAKQQELDHQDCQLRAELERSQAGEARVRRLLELHAPQTLVELSGPQHEHFQGVPMNVTERRAQLALMRCRAAALDAKSVRLNPETLTASFGAAGTRTATLHRLMTEAERQVTSYPNQSGPPTSAGAFRHGTPYSVVRALSRRSPWTVSSGARLVPVQGSAVST